MNMEEKSTRRYLSFCKSLDNLNYLVVQIQMKILFLVVLPKHLILPSI